jgi:hypothetical protein
LLLALTATATAPEEAISITSLLQEDCGFWWFLRQ